MATGRSARWPTGRHRSRVSLRRAVTPSLYGLSVPVLVAASVALLGVVGASAATLGGLKTGDLGSSNAGVAIHGTGITATWTPALVATTWVVSGITLKTAATDTFSAGEKVSVTLVSSTGAQLCEIAATAPTASTSLAITRANINSGCGSSGIDFASIDRVAVATVR